MKKLLSLVMIFCMIFTFSACGGGNHKKENEKIITDNAIFNKHNETIFSTPSQSTSKVAFPFKNETVGECVVTIDFDNAINENFGLSLNSIGSDFLNITNYVPEELLLEAAVSAFAFKMELSTKTMETPELYRDGRWVLKKTDSGYQHHLYYIFDDSENEYNLRFLINSDDSDTAMLYAQNFVNIFHFYTPISSGNYVNVKDIDGNEVSLNDCRFFCDVAAIALANSGLHISDSTYISNYTGGVISVTVPLAENFVSYTIDFVNEKYLDSQSAIIDTFNMNDHTVNMVQTMGDNIKRYFIESGKYFIKINASYPNEISNGSRQKELFVDHFN